MGRPTKYTQELADRLCEHLIEGKSLRSFCKEEDAPGLSTVCNWLATNEAFAEQYTRARENQADTLADELVSIADDEPDPQKARVRVDARKWVASKLKPKKYGDYQRVDHKVSGNLGVHDMTDEELQAELSKLAGADGCNAKA